MMKPLNTLLRGITLCLLVVCLSNSSTSAQPINELGKPLIKNYSPKEYKGFPQVFGVAQDTNGIVYFTGNGITEFDGNTWRKIPPLEMTTWSVMRGNDGRIYVGGVDDLGYLLPDSLGRQAFVSLLPLLAEKDRNFGELRQMAVLGDAIYFSSRTGYLLKYDSKKETIRSWRYEQMVFSLGVVAEKLYVYISENGLYTLDGDALVLVPGGDFFAEIPVTAMLPYKKEQILLATTDNGLYIYDGQSMTPFKTQADAVLTANWLYRAILLPDTTYAFASIDQGLTFIDEDGHWLQQLSKSDGLLNNIVYALHYDPAGKLWVGYDTGLSQIELFTPFSYFWEDAQNAPLSSEVIIRHQDILYLGSSNGVFYLDPKGQRVRPIKDYPVDQVFGLTVAGNRLFVSGGAGFHEIKGDRAISVLWASNRASGNIYSAHQSKVNKNHFFLGKLDGLGYIRNTQGKWMYDGKYAEIPDNVSIRDFVEKQAGILWFGTENQGVWKVDYQSSASANGKAVINKVLSFKTDYREKKLGKTFAYLIDDLVTFTGAGGIYIYDEARDQLIPDQRFPLPRSYENILQVVLAEDKDGKVYAHFIFKDGNVEMGIYERQAKGKYTWDTSPFKQLAKENMLNVTKIFPEPDGITWIAGGDGVIRFDTRKTVVLAEFSIKIRAVTIGQDSILYLGHGLADRPVLDYRYNAIEFNYLATNINLNGQNQYQSYLEGFDENWSHWSPKMEKAYTNVPEGKYTFRVRGKDQFGQMGKEAAYSFRILPPWWRTWWAYLGYVLLGTGILYLFSQWRNQQLRRQSLILEQTVAARTREMEQRVEELSTVDDISIALTKHMSWQDLIQLVGDKMRDLFKANLCYVALLDKKSQVISFPYGYGDEFPDMKLGEGLTSKIIMTGESLLINEQVTQAYSKFGIAAAGKEAASYLGVPIPFGKEVIGVISVQSTEQTNRFGKADERLLGTIAAHVGIALQNAQLFEAAEQARAQAEEASEAKSTFLSTVSHELRTPLTSVIGFAKIIKKRLEERILPYVNKEEKKTDKAINQVRQNLDVVISEGERLTTLINTVLDLAKIEAGKLDWNMESLQIREVVEQATAASSSLFQQKNLPLHIEIEENLPLITADKDRLVQVVINLISNAVKFTDQGDVTIKAVRENGTVQVSVKDSGIGISEEDQVKVFEKFKQVGNTLTDKPKGTGLGLPICKEIIEHHEGHIWVESELGRGSTFMFSLPLAMEQLPTAEPIKKMPHGTIAQEKTNSLSKNKLKTILVVDDEPGIRNLLRQEISEAGFQITEAVNGKEAVASIRQHQPDLVILDVLMPEMNGFDVAAILKSDPATKHIPIIVLSIVDDKQRISSLGVDAYLTKPIDIHLLLKEINTLI